MKNKYYLLVLLAMLVLVSCKSKKILVAASKPPVVVAGIDTISLTADQVTEDKQVQSRATVEKDVARQSSISSVLDAKIVYSVDEVSASAYSGVEQIAKYDFTHPDVPEAFDGFCMAFISDLHYKSLLQEKGLNDIVRLLIDQKPDILLMGGDYQEGCQYVEPLFAALSKVKTPMGTYGVLGNNDYERCHAEIVQTMQQYGMHVLEQKIDTLRKDGQQIILAGVRNPFDLANNGTSPTLHLSPSDFVILLVHTPDYVEDVPVTNTDLALAGHTHGGQVRIFGIAPMNVSHYGKRFLTGLGYNSANIPVVVTNGIGTSQQPIRFGAPAEIVMITLHRLTE